MNYTSLRSCSRPGAPGGGQVPPRGTRGRQQKRPRRAFGKRPPAPKKTKRKPGRPFAGARKPSTVRQGPRPPRPAMAFGFWYWRVLATGTAWAGLCLIHHHHHLLERAVEGRMLIEERDPHHHVVVVSAPPGRLAATTTDDGVRGRRACSSDARPRRRRGRCRARRQDLRQGRKLQGPVSCGRGLYQPTETDRKWKSRPRRPSESAQHWSLAELELARSLVGRNRTRRSFLVFCWAMGVVLS